MKRSDCLNWLKKNGFDIPEKSRCTHCTFQSQKDWEEQKKSAPLDWAQSVSFDKSIRNLSTKPGRQLYLHRSIKPLPQAILLPEDEGYVQPELIVGPGCDTAGYCWD
jgi:hypothetical protein